VHEGRFYYSFPFVLTKLPSATARWCRFSAAGFTSPPIGCVSIRVCDRAAVPARHCDEKLLTPSPDGFYRCLAARIADGQKRPNNIGTRGGYLSRAVEWQKAAGKSFGKDIARHSGDLCLTFFGARRRRIGRPELGCGPERPATSIQPRLVLAGRMRLPNANGYEQGRPRHTRGQP
jgi:hypothetical protein